MFKQLRLWVWALWAAALVGSIVAVAGGARGSPAASPTAGPTTTEIHGRLTSLARSASVPWSLASAIHRAASASRVSPWILVAIAMQESSVRPIHRWYPNGTADLGWFQINSRTALAHGCRIERLLQFDPDESARCAALVLRHKRDVCLARGLSDWAANGCYHNYRDVHRVPYLKALERWL